MKVRIGFRRPGGLFVMLALSIGCTSGAVVLPGRSVVLSGEQTSAAVQLCSRAGPGEVEQAWQVPESVVVLLEADLGKLARLRAVECCIVGARVKQPGGYYRQYVGVVINGKQLVYINAFRSVETHQAWRHQAVGVCDGGDDYWGALYDPMTRSFSSLAFNGIA